MRITFLLGSAFILELLAILFLILNLRAITIQTLPWIALVLSAFIISIPLTIYGKQLILFLCSLFHVKIPFTPDMYVDDKYVIVTRADSKFPYVGFSVIKVIPLTPTVDMKDEEKLRIIKSLEALVYSLPAPLQYCMSKMPSKEVLSEIKKLQTELARYEALASKHRGLEARVEAIRQELQRLRRSSIMVSGLYMKVYCSDFTEERVKECLEKMIASVVASVSQINARAEVLRYTDLWEYLELEKKGEAYSIVAGIGASPVRT